MADGSIVIDTKLRTKQATAELATMQKELTRMENALDRQRQKAENVSSAYAKQSKVVSDLAAQQEALTNKAEAQRNAIKRNQEVIVGYNTGENISPQAFMDAKTALPQQMSELSATEKELEAINKQLFKEDDKLADINANLQQQKALQSDVEQSINVQTQRITEQQERVKRSQAGQALANGFQSATKPIAEVGKRIKTLAKRVLLFSLITKALRGIKSYFSTALASNEQFQASLATLNVALRTAFQPIMDYIIPALTRLISYLATAAAAVASFMSMLFGQSLSDTKASANALYDESEALKATGGGAKDAGKQLAAFDEINKLDESGGGGGGGATVKKPNFDFDDPLADVSERKLKNILALVGEIAAGFAGWKIGSALGKGLKGSIGLALSLAGAIGTVTAFIDAWENGLDTGNMTRYLSSALSLAVGLGMAFSPIAGIIGIIVAAIGAGVLGLKDLNETGRITAENATMIQVGASAAFGAIGNLIGAALQVKAHWGEISTFFNGVWESIKETWGTVSDWFLENVIEPVANFFGTSTEEIAEFFRGCWLIIKAIWEVVSTWFDENVLQPLKEFFEPILDDIGTFFSNCWDTVKEVWEGASTWFDENVIQPISNFFKGLINGIIGFLETGINNMIDKINVFLSLFNSVATWAGGIVGEDWSGVGMLEHVSIPRLAQGAVIPANHEFAAILGDQKSGVNIETPLDTMVQAFRTALGGNSGSSKTVVFEIDKREFARIVYDLAQSESKRVGAQLGGAY